MNEDLDRCLQEEIKAGTKLITEGQGKSGVRPTCKELVKASFGIFWMLLAESQFDCVECEFEYDKIYQID